MNPLDLPGPQFLVFQGFVAAIALLALYVLRTQSENGRPAALGVADPYLIAYLRGGQNEALRVATIALIDRGLITQDGNLLTSTPEAAKMVTYDLERAVLEVYKRGGAPSDVFTAAMTAHATWTEYDHRLEQAGLLPDDAMRAHRRHRFRVACAIVLGLAAVKLVVALSRGRTNVVFLVVLSIAFLVAAYRIGHPRLTVRGHRVLRDLRELFTRLKARAGTLAPGGGNRDVAMLSAVFGVTALPAERFPYVRQLYPRAAQSTTSCCGSSWGSSCGGGDGGGGGCGGCSS